LADILRIHENVPRDIHFEIFAKQFPFITVAAAATSFSRYLWKLRQRYILMFFLLQN